MIGRKDWVKIAAIIVAAGSGKRFGSKKQFENIGNEKIVELTASKFSRIHKIDNLVVVLPKEDLSRRYNFPKRVKIVKGGATRQQSVFNGLLALDTDTDIVLIHDGVRPYVSAKIIIDSISAANKYGACVTAVPSKDTAKIAGKGFAVSTPERKNIFLAQTPQAFRYSLIMKAYRKASAEKYFSTDDSSLVERLGKKVRIVPGDYGNIKITTKDDLNSINSKTLKPTNVRLRVGLGYDIHKLVKGKPLYLGGLRIPFPKGLLAHSDGDVLLHAICDSLLGAADLGDIGKHFPDTDNRYKGISSLILLKKTVELLQKTGHEIINIDVMLVAKEPKIAPHIAKMKKAISKIIEIKEISIKATTNEGVGDLGKGKAICAYSICLIEKRRL